MSKKLDQSLVDAYASIYEARRGHAAGSSDLEKQASQLASDVRYKAKGRVKEGTNREELKKIYLGLIQSSPAPNVVKQMAKKKLVGESYIPEEGYDIARDMGKVKPSKDKKDATTMPRSNKKREKENLDNKKKGDQALDSVIAGLRKKYGKNAVMDMSKKKKKVDEGVGEFLDNKIKKPIKNKVDKTLTGLTQKFHLGSTKELGSVASPNSGTYKEDVESVSIDEKKLVHGTYGNFVSGQKSEKKSDKPITADQRRMIPEKMDPVGQEDGDINNDGKKDGTDKYLASRRKAIGKAIAKKRGRVKEGFSAWRVDLDFQEQVKK